MTFKKIVGFGDSWMYGDELLDPELVSQDSNAHSCWTQNTNYREQHCFLGLLGRHYRVPTENFGIPGGSLQSSIWTALWWLEHEPNPEQCLVLVAHTDHDRITHYNPNHVHYSNDPPWNKFVHSSWVHHGSSVIPEPFRDLIKRQMVLTSCPELDQLQYQQTAIFFDGVSARRNIPMLQFHVMPAGKTLMLPTEIWPGFSLTMWFRDHPNNQKRELIMPGGHPNEIGHQMISERLISEIDRAIIQ
jgi:hypothetical protein